MAVVEARTFNYIAYSNRAIAADLVAMTTMHAYMSMMSAEVAMLGGGGEDMIVAMILELASCNPWGGELHCWHAIDDGIKAFKYFNAERKYGGRLKNLEGTFNQSIQGLRVSVDLIHLSQMLMYVYAMKVVSGQGLRDIQSYNDPQSKTGLPGMVIYENLKNLACAAQGTFLDSLCGHNKLGNADQSKLLAEVANASRPKFTTHRGYELLPALLLTSLGQKLMFDIPGNGFTMPLGLKGTAKLVAGRSKLNGSDEAIDVQDVGAEDSGLTFSYVNDRPGFGSYSADIYSDKKNGQHHPSQAHKGQHKEFKGLHDCLGYPTTCFIKFRADQQAKHHFDQPMVYYYTTRDLSVNRKGVHGPWELNKQGKVNVEFGSKSASLTLRAGTGAALSQAMVYYHRLGDWQDAPNFFSPYWRAKLQPLDSTTAARILGGAGNADAAEVALAKGPVD